MVLYHVLWGGTCYVLVAIDVFSKLAINRLEKHYFVTIGKPARVLVDHGKQFTAKRFGSFLGEHHVKLVFSSVRHPQGNPAERVMRELGRLFRTYCRNKQTTWAKEMRQFGELLNNVVHESIGFAPCSCTSIECLTHRCVALLHFRVHRLLPICLRR